MKLLVTGGTGFIGSHFVKLALNEGHDVTVLRRTEYSKPRILLEKEPNWISDSMAKLEPTCLANYDAIVHLAAKGVTSLDEPIDAVIEANVLHPLKLFKSAARAGVKRFVITGSCFEYGQSADRYDRIPPNAPLEPTTPYAVSKAAASLAFCSFANQENVSLTIHRVFHVFGEGEADNRLWPSLRRAAMSGEDFPMTAGEQIRDFIPVEDVVSKLLLSCDEAYLLSPNSSIENLCTGIPKSVREFAEFFWKRWNACGKLKFGSLPYRKNEIMRCVGQPKSK